MEIKIDGREPEPPPYAKHTARDEGFYLSALAASLEEYGVYKRELDRGVRALADTFSKDPNHKEIIAGSLMAGPTRIQSWYFEHLASGLANMLAKEDDYLELIDTRDPKEVKEETVSRVKHSRSNLGPSFFEARIGTSLNDGRLVFRGNLDTISNVGGGSVFVEGDVKKIEQTGSGIIFVDGNVDSIDEAQQTIIAITGSLGKYREYRLHQRGEREGSPYIFASKIGEVDRNLYKVKGDGLPTLEYPTEVDLSFLKGCAPVLAIDAAMNMAKNVAVTYAEEILNIAEGAPLNAKALARFARTQMFAYILGHGSGYFQSTADHARPDPYD